MAAQYLTVENGYDMSHQFDQWCDTIKKYEYLYKKGREKLELSAQSLNFFDFIL